MGKKPDDPLFNLADALADDVIAASDEDLLREAAEDHGDALALSRTFDKLIAGEKGQGAEIVDFTRAASARSADVEKVSPHEIRSGSRSIDPDGRMKFASTPVAARPRGFAMPQWFQIAAALVLGVGIGFAGDASLRRETEGDWRQAIATYQSLSVEKTATDARGSKILSEPASAPVVKNNLETSLRTEDTRKIAEIATKLGLALKSETLRVPNLEFQNAQLLHFQDRPLAKFTYLNAQGKEITFSIFHDGEADSSPKRVKYDGLEGVSWNKGGYGFLVISSSTIEELLRAATALAKQVKVN